jgi:hypothetical protein
VGNSLVALNATTNLTEQSFQITDNIHIDQLLEELSLQGIPETQIDFLIQSLELKWQTGKKAGLVERAQKAFQESIFNSF